MCEEELSRSAEEKILQSGERARLSEQRWCAGVGKAHLLETDVRCRRSQRLRRDRIEHGRRGDQQFGELGGFGQAALQSPIDLVNSNMIRVAFE